MLETESGLFTKEEGELVKFFKWDKTMYSFPPGPLSLPQGDKAVLWCGGLKGFLTGHCSGNRLNILSRHWPLFPPLSPQGLLSRRKE